MTKTILVVGGTSGVGAAVATDLVEKGDGVILTGRDGARAEQVAASLGDRAQGIALDLSKPETIAPALARVGNLGGLVLGAIERDQNSVREYDLARATPLTTLKLVGYTETVHTLLDRLDVSVDTGIVLFGGR